MRTDRNQLWDAAGNLLSQADVQVDDTAEINETSVRDRAAAALDANTTFLALSSPSNAQVVAQVKALARQNNALIRLLLGRFDGTD